jgi:hypothetical protein
MMYKNDEVFFFWQWAKFRSSTKMSLSSLTRYMMLLKVEIEYDSN